MDSILVHIYKPKCYGAVVVDMERDRVIAWAPKLKFLENWTLNQVQIFADTGPGDVISQPLIDLRDHDQPGADEHIPVPVLVGDSGMAKKRIITPPKKAGGRARKPKARGKKGY